MTNTWGHWNRIVAVERNIRNVVVRGVPLKGKLDKLEFQGKENHRRGPTRREMWTKRAKSWRRPAGERNPDGGDYWRQAEPSISSW